MADKAGHPAYIVLYNSTLGWKMPGAFSKYYSRAGMILEICRLLAPLVVRQCY